MLLAATAWWLLGADRGGPDPLDDPATLVVLQVSAAPGAFGSGAGGEPLARAVEDLVEFCRLEVGGLLGVEGVRDRGGGRYDFELERELDDEDEARFVACFEDLGVTTALSAEVVAIECRPAEACQG